MRTAWQEIGGSPSPEWEGGEKDENKEMRVEVAGERYKGLGDEEGSRERKGVDILYLFSWPLIGRTGHQDKKEMQPLDFDEEEKMLHLALEASNKRVRICKHAATTENLVRQVTLGMRTIHYSGHGRDGFLAFEDGMGKMHRLEHENLKQIITAGGGLTTIQFAFVSACQSQLAGEAFVKAYTRFSLLGLALLIYVVICIFLVHYHHCKHALLRHQHIEIPSTLMHRLECLT
jgi:hypothetical protein